MPTQKQTSFTPHDIIALAVYKNRLPVITPEITPLATTSVDTHLIDTVFATGINVNTGSNHTHCIKLHDKALRSDIKLLFHDNIRVNSNDNDDEHENNKSLAIGSQRENSKL